MKIAFVRSVDLYQAHPTLALIKDYCIRNDITLKLYYTDGECNQILFPGEYEKVEENISAEELAELIKNWGADCAISISIPDNNSLRDALVKLILKERHGIPFVMHPLDTTMLMCNKWDTTRFLKNLGMLVPDAILLYADLLNNRGTDYLEYKNYLERKICDIGFPVIAKPLWDSMSLGMRVIDSSQDLRNWLKHDTPNYDMVIERYISGGEYFCMEVIGTEGQYFCQPLVKKCFTSNKKIDLLPFNHFRYAPYRTNNHIIKEAIQEFKQSAIEIAKLLQVCGAIEFDLVMQNGKFYMLEMNPRVTGTTNLYSAISGCNTYERLLDIALGKFKPLPIKEHFATEFALENMNDETLQKLYAYSEFDSIIKVIYHNGMEQYRTIIKAGDIKACYEFLLMLEEKYNVIPHTILEEVLEEVRNL